MNRARLFFRMMLKATWLRRDRALTALLSVIVVATMATVALSVYSDLESKISREFRSFGANVVLTQASGHLGKSDLEKMQAVLSRNAGSPGEVAPVAYAIASASADQHAVLGGTELSVFQAMNSFWSTRTVSATGNALLGSRAAQRLSPSGTPFTISFQGKTLEILPRLIFQSGSEDDSRIYVGLSDFIALTGREPDAALIRINGNATDIRAGIQNLSQAFPAAEVKPMRDITAAQTLVLGKTRSVVLASSAVVVVLIMLCMLATFTSSVLERRKDFAVMKALGASNRMVNLLFATEAMFLAVIGSVSGYVAGSGIAFWIGKVNFDTAIHPQLKVLPEVLLGSIMLALLASTAPLRLLQQIQPARILRGE